MSLRTAIVVMLAIMAFAPSLAQADPPPAQPPTIGQLIEQFAVVSDDPADRTWSEAVYSAGRMKDSFQPLVEALKSSNRLVKAGAIEALRMSQRREAFEPIAALVRDSDPGVQQSALVALNEINPDRAAPYLVDVLNNRSSKLRMYAASLLAYRGDRRAGDVALEALKKPYPKEQTEALRILNRLRDKRGVDDARRLLLGTNPEVAQAAAAYLDYLPDYNAFPDMLAAMKKGRPMGSLLARYGPEACDALIEFSESPNALIRADAAGALSALLRASALSGQMDTYIELVPLKPLGQEQLVNATRAMVRLSGDKNAEIRESARLSLRYGDPKQVMPIAEKLMESKAASDRSDAIFILPATSDSGQAPKLSDDLLARVQKIVMLGLDDQNREVRQDALGALTRFPVPQAATKLTAMLGRRPDAMSTASYGPADGLRRVGLNAFPAVLSVATSPAHQGRLQAIGMLGGWGDPQSVKALIALASDKKPVIRQAAILALRECDPAVTRAILQNALRNTDAQVRLLGIGWIADTCYPEVIQTLADALRDPDAAIREAAASGFAERNNDSGIDVLSICLRAGMETRSLWQLQGLPISTPPPQWSRLSPPCLSTQS